MDGGVLPGVGLLSLLEQVCDFLPVGAGKKGASFCPLEKLGFQVLEDQMELLFLLAHDFKSDEATS